MPFRTLLAVLLSAVTFGLVGPRAAAQSGAPATTPVELTSTLQPALSSQTIPIRLAVQADGPCATRLAYQVQRVMDRSDVLQLGNRSPLLVRLEASDETQFGLSAGRCAFLVRVVWDVLPYQDGDERGRHLLTGIRSKHGQTLARRSGRIRGGQEVATAEQIASFVESAVRNQIGTR